ncbi:DUF1428 domain-containing protein [Sulfitobacter sp. M368]|uniref:DUF1428 domain-containing protein n=1 Tax=Sulfitobacter sp. M368 TaxID=2867021 RepID=UPI0021A86654|nr:DUF1428 domain-containing protein [Sulfitobacter sp. M368]UWR15009.1 DUF1428 domain-containing protein [Sulfitobacter sp. M368]
MPYVNGMVVAVPNASKEAYIRMARAMVPLFEKHGALEVVDCWGVDVPPGKVTSFPMAVQCKEDETVVFSWITWPDKATADSGMEAAMSDPAMGEIGDFPFDGARMIFGGFERI